MTQLRLTSSLYTSNPLISGVKVTQRSAWRLTGWPLAPVVGASWARHWCWRGLMTCVVLWRDRHDMACAALL